MFDAMAYSHLSVHLTVSLSLYVGRERPAGRMRLLCVYFSVASCRLCIIYLLWHLITQNVPNFRTFLTHCSSVRVCVFEFLNLTLIVLGILNNTPAVQLIVLFCVSLSS